MNANLIGPWACTFFNFVYILFFFPSRLKTRCFRLYGRDIFTEIKTN